VTVSSHLRQLIDAAAPYWAGEAEVVRTYWTWNGRTRETDRRWLARQCYKEFLGLGLGYGVDGEDLGPFRGPLEELRAAFPRVDVEIDRHEVLGIAELLKDEFSHYCAFADAHDGLALPGEPKLNPKMLAVWNEEENLARVRREHTQRHRALGRRACQFTEGGYCSLFSEGMRLHERPTPGHEAADGLIAAACARVYDDEFGHMLRGIVGLDDEGLAEAEWRTLAEISIAQLRHRILMRNEQFSFPVAEGRLKDLLAGGCTPVAFDYDRARIAA
jgi:hypothetical protein